MGVITNDYLMTLIYNASDVFIAPSLADNLPTTIFESLCCGTAVVGFEIGGIPDLIQHQVNGYLAKYKDAEDLANGIEYCIQYKLNGSILPVFEPASTIQKHLELFEKIGM
jgi:glycosyltransferase involved in cell wall biosynthesis